MSKATDFTDDFFSEVPIQEEAEVDLPSRGMFYTFTDGTKTLRVRPLNLGDEKAIAGNKSIKPGNAMNALIGRVVLNMEVENLLVMDKIAILLKIREISVSPTYKTVGICSHCQADTTLSFDLGDMPINYLPKDFKYPIEVELPVMGKYGKNATVELPRVTDEVYMQNEEDILNNLYRFVVSIGAVESKPQLRLLLEDDRFPYLDATALIKAIYASEYGMQTEVKYKCAECAGINVTNLRIGEDFFTGN